MLMITVAHNFNYC